MREIPAGIKGKSECMVSAENTAASLGSGFLAVFGTPYLCALVEGACMNAIKDFLDEGEGTVGISVDISHTAATPVGMKVWVETEVVKCEGRKITFTAKAYDEAGSIGEAFHERFVIYNEKFMKKAEGKLKKQ